MKVSVAICTWNRAKLLDETLAHMSHLRVPAGTEWELLVVNNNCADATDEVLARHSDRLPIRRLFEPKQGLSNARNCAVAAASGELLVWTDDDVLVERDWLAEYVSAASRWPEADFFGGTVDPRFDGEPPAWLRRNIDALQGPYALRQLGSAVRPLRPEEDPFGANMAFRTPALRKYAFDPNLGRTKTDMMGGEELAIVQRLKDDGHRGVWVGTARVKHYVSPERQTLRYLWEWYRGYGRTTVRLEGLGDVRCMWGVPRWAIRRYWTARLQSWCLSLSKGPRWLRAFSAAARAQGVMDEARALHRARGRPPRSLAGPLPA